MQAAFSIDLRDGHRATAIRVRPDAVPWEVVEALGIPEPCGVMILIGGTEELSGSAAAGLQQQLSTTVAGVVAGAGLTVVTGGTDAGVIALLGQGLARSGVDRPVIGVVPEGRAIWPGHPAADGDAADLEPHHTHFVLVRGEAWGDETPLLLGIADELARRAAAVVVLASGGSVARQELVGLVERGHHVVVLGGSGRLADEVAAASGGGTGTVLDGAIERGQVEILPAGSAPAELVARLRRSLAGRAG